MTTVGLEGRLCCANEAEAALVRRHLPAHIRLTHAEPGCLAFTVEPSDDPFVWTVRERFVDAASFEAHQARLDETHNFTEREVTVRGETTTAEVSSVGTLVTSSGVLSVLDFGYDNDDARPLARSVAPGAYPVDRVTGFGRNAAVRVRFSDHDPVAWHPAAIPGSGHVFGVDAGSACIVDYVAYASMTKRAKAARYAQFVAAPRPAAVEVSLDAGDTGIVVDSGYGDGSYPVYWGVDADGEVAQLVVDFMLLVDEDEDEDGTLVHR